MVDSIPLSAFENARDSVIVSDADGKLRLVNASARRLLNLEGPGEDLPCWKLCKLKTPEDRRFCGPHCPVQKLALGGVRYSRRSVLYTSAHGARAADLLSIAIPPMHGGRCAVFHLIATHERQASFVAAREAAVRSHPEPRRETSGGGDRAPAWIATPLRWLRHRS